MEKALAFAAVDSALTEPRPDLEILIIDDHTTDGTWDRLTDVVADPRARMLRNERNLGLFPNFNRCLDEARGRYIRILCSDDVLEPGSLNEELAVMEHHPELSLLTTRGLRVAPDGRVLGVQAAALPEGCYRGDRGIAAVVRANAGTGYNTLNYPSGILLRREAADAAGRFRADMRMSGDVEYFLRVLRHGGLGVLHRIGCRITVHPDQVGSRLSLDPVVMEELFALLDEFAPDLGDQASERDARRAMAGLSVWHATRSALQGDFRLTADHLAVARKHGAGASDMASGFARLLRHRARWTLRGPFVPHDVVPDAAL